MYVGPSCCSALYICDGCCTTRCGAKTDRPPCCTVTPRTHRGRAGPWGGDFGPGSCDGQKSVKGGVSRIRFVSKTERACGVRGTSPDAPEWAWTKQSFKWVQRNGGCARHWHHWASLVPGRKRRERKREIFSRRRRRRLAARAARSPQSKRGGWALSDGALLSCLCHETCCTETRTTRTTRFAHGGYRGGGD